MSIQKSNVRTPQNARVGQRTTKEVEQPALSNMNTKRVKPTRIILGTLSKPFENPVLISNTDQKPDMKTKRQQGRRIRHHLSPSSQYGQLISELKDLPRTEKIIYF